MALRRLGRAALPAFVVAMALVPSAAHADEALDAAHANWTGRSAVPLPTHDGVVALFGPSRIGLPHDLEVSFHTVGLLAPHAAILHRYGTRGRFHFAGRYGLAYPFPFLAMMTGSGTGKLLPGDTTPPQALMFDLGARVTHVARRPVLTTLELAFVVAPRFTRTSSPLLDFPFLYPRFAALDGPFVFRAGLASEGVVAGPLRWVLAVEAYAIPAVSRGFALEQRGGLALFARRRFGFELGGRTSYARYPLGLRFHVTPYLDLSARW